MAVDQMIQKVQDALKLGKLKSKLPRNPKVVDIRVEDYVDYRRRGCAAGDDRHRRGCGRREFERSDDITDLVKRRFAAAIRELGVELWPYIRFAKPSELEEDDDEE